MSIFSRLGNISYEDGIQLDSAFSVLHSNYNKTPEFYAMRNQIPINELEQANLQISNMTDDVLLSTISSFDGTKEYISAEENCIMWKAYWLEYINAFDKMVDVLPNSVVTAYIGRQTVEMGFKYLLILEKGTIKRSHDLGALANSVFKAYKIKKGYWDYVDVFCVKYGKYIEGGHPEYFRYPEYKKNRYFAGTQLDIPWIIYNLAIIVLKQLKLAEIDIEDTE